MVLCRERHLDGNGIWMGTAFGWERHLDGNGIWMGTAFGWERSRPFPTQIPSFIKCIRIPIFRVCFNIIFDPVQGTTISNYVIMIGFLPFE